MKGSLDALGLIELVRPDQTIEDAFQLQSEFKSSEQNGVGTVG